MKRLRAWLRRANGVFRKERRDAEFAAEVKAIREEMAAIDKDVPVGQANRELRAWL